MSTFDQISAIKIVEVNYLANVHLYIFIYIVGGGCG
jgi:hypothetical protein